MREKMDTLFIGLVVFVCMFIGLNMAFMANTHEKSVIQKEEIKPVAATIEKVELVIPSDYQIAVPDESHQIHTVRITGYTPDGKKTAIGDNVKVGYSCAVSPKCLFMLGKKIYVEGHGVRYVNDLTAAWLDEKFEYCTIDLAVPTSEYAKKIGNTRTRAVIIE